MSIAQRLVKARNGTVTAGGLTWHLQIPTLAEVLAAGARHLSRIEVTPPLAEGEEPPPVVVADPQARVEAAIDQMREGAALACAWVTGVQDGAGPVEPIRLVAELAEERPDEGVVWVGSLPPSVVAEIIEGAAALCTDGGRLSRAIATFPPGSE